MLESSWFASSKRSRLAILSMKEMKSWCEMVFSWSQASFRYFAPFVCVFSFSVWWWFSCLNLCCIWDSIEPRWWIVFQFTWFFVWFNEISLLDLNWHSLFRGYSGELPFCVIISIIAPSFPYWFGKNQRGDWSLNARGFIVTSSLKAWNHWSPKHLAKNGKGS